jgi:hypothetical protein
MTGNLDFTGYTGLFAGTRSFTMGGNLTFGTGMTVGSRAESITFNSTSGTKTITSNGVQYNKTFTFNGVGGSWTLQDDLDMTGASARALNVINGSLITNGKQIKVAQFISGAGGTVDFGSATHEISGASGTPLDTNGTIVAGTYTLKFTDTGNGNIIFNTRGKTFNNVWFSRGTSTGNISFPNASATFNDFKDDGTEAHSILFTAGTTQTVNTFTVSGTVANLITIDSTTTGTHNLVKLNGGFISCDYLNIQHSVAKPANSWYAGQYSVDNQGVVTAGSGWIFTAPTANFLEFF